MAIVKYLNPRNDVAFKRLFAKENNKDTILKHFLNDVISRENKQPITKITLLNPSFDPDTAYKKQSILDILCEEEDGTKYIVEMQVAKISGFEKRAQYYASKVYASQPNIGDSYDQLKKVIFLAITEYNIFPNKSDYKSVHNILDTKTHENDLQDFTFIFVSLPKFKKTIDELHSIEDKWYYFFKHANDPEDMHTLIKNSDEVIKRAYKELEAHNWTNQELLNYEAVEKINRDAISREKYVYYEGRKEGREEGEKKGREKGIKKVEKQVEKKAEKKKKL